MRKIKVIISFILIFLSFLNLFLLVKNNLSKFTEKFDPKKYEEKYNKSQYVIPNSKNPISDAELYAYAGYKYIIGENPLYLNAEHLTVGKYLIGLSTVIFNNENYSTLLVIILFILISFYLIFNLTKSLLLSSFLILLITSDSFIKDSLISSPLLDIYQLFFFFISLIFFINWHQNKKIIYLISAGIFLGLFSASKFYLATLIILCTYFIFLIITKKESLKKNLFYLISIMFFLIITFTATYTISFIKGSTINEFIKSQKWIFNFWRFNSLNNVDAKGNFLNLILFNKWKIWWDNKHFINYKDWNLSWPIFYITGLFMSILNLVNFKKQKSKLTILDNYLLIISIWIINYSFYLYFIPIYPRYLILIYPFIYFLIILFFAKILDKKYV